MMKKMLAATLALGLMTGGASAQVSSGEAMARKEADAARAQAEKLAAEVKELQRRLEALERQRGEGEGRRRPADVERSRSESDRSRSESDRRGPDGEAVRRHAEAMARAAEGRARGEEVRKQVEEARKRAAEARKALVERAAKGESGEGKKEAYIGVVTDKVPEVLSAHLDLQGGLLVAQVQPDSPAAKAGLKANDLILAMNGTALTSPDQLKKLVVAEKAGAKASLTILRGGKKDTVSVVLGERNANTFGQFFGPGGNKFFLEGRDAEDIYRKALPGSRGGTDVWSKKDLPDGVKIFRKEKKGEGAKGEGGSKADAEARAKAIYESGKAGSKADGEARAKAIFDAARAGGAAGSGTTTISIRVGDDGKISVSATVTKDGKTETVQESGTKEELLKKLDKFPAAVRESIRQSIESAEQGPGGKGGRVRIESRVRADATAADKDGKKIVVRTLDPKGLAELKAQGGNVVVDGKKIVIDSKVEALKGKDGLKKHIEILKSGDLKALEGLKDVKVLRSEDLKALKGLEGLKNVKVLRAEDLKGLEGLKDVDVQVRVLAPEKLKDLKDKLPKEIEVHVEKALKDAGLKDKLKEKVILDRRDSQ